MSDTSQKLYLTSTDSNEILVSSYLTKKPTLNSTSLVKGKHATNIKDTHVSNASVEATPPSHHWFLKSGSHKYWCVLRRNQLSYYKDKTERKAVSVIPSSDVLNYRTLEEKGELDIYTKKKTFRFKTESRNTLKQWKDALDVFMGQEPVADVIDGAKRSNSNGTYEGIEDEDEDEDDYDVICETDVDRGTGIQLSASDVTSINNGISEEDKMFYEMYSPQTTPVHLIQSGVLYGRVKKHLGRKKWKKFKAVLDNRTLILQSMSSGKTIKEINLNKVIDCVEVEKTKDDICFAIITYDERLKFRALNEREIIEWIINLKSCVLVRKKAAK